MRKTEERYREALQSLSFYKSASNMSRKELAAQGKLIIFRKNKYVFSARESVKYLYVMVSGYTVLERINRQNVKRVIFLLGKDEILNEVILEKDTSSVGCSVIEQAEIIAFPRNLILKLMEQDFALSQYIFQSLAVKLRKSYHQLENTTKMTTLDRQIASRLWKLSRDYGIACDGFTELPFEISITFLAEFVGSNRETVSRIIKKFSNAGILDIQEKRCRIYDRDKLTEVLEGTLQL